MFPDVSNVLTMFFSVSSAATAATVKAPSKVTGTQGFAKGRGTQPVMAWPL